MSRYIDARKLADTIDCLDTVEGEDNAVFIYDVIQAINDAPGEDVQKVIHGVWNGTQYETISRYRRRIRNTRFKCSVCGESNGRKKTPYCGRCGAKMDGGDV